MYVYKCIGSRTYWVGFYDPEGMWNQESTQPTAQAAAARVHYLNGGNDPDAPSMAATLEEARWSHK